MDDLSYNSLRLELEALIFSSSKGLTSREIKSALKISDESIIPKIVSDINELNFHNNSVLYISYDGFKYQFSIRDSFLDHPVIMPFTAGSDFNQAQVKTLAFIAYNQPVEYQDIIDFIGRGSKKAIQILLHRKFISYETDNYDILDQTGKEKKIRVKIFSTTEHFAEYFHLPNDTSLIKENIEKIIEKV